MEIQEMKKMTPAHQELLLQADPSWQLVSDYLARGVCFEGVEADQLLAIMVLLPTRPETLELVNLAVIESRHNQGLAQEMIRYAIVFAKSRHFKTLAVGTGSTGIGQLYLYQKCGFRMIGIDHDFFVRHYKEPIFENGLELKDMVRLKLEL